MTLNITVEMAHMMKSKIAFHQNTQGRNGHKKRQMYSGGEGCFPCKKITTVDINVPLATVYLGFVDVH